MLAKTNSVNINTIENWTGKNKCSHDVEKTEKWLTIFKNSQNKNLIELPRFSMRKYLFKSEISKSLQMRNFHRDGHYRLFSYFFKKFRNFTKVCYFLIFLQFFKLYTHVSALQQKKQKNTCKLFS